MNTGPDSPATNNQDGPGRESKTDVPVRRRVTIINSRGLHARAAAKFAAAAAKFEARILVSRGELTVSGLSIMGLMMLAASPGSDIELTATGPDAKAAIETLAALIADKFQEDDG